GGSLLPGDAAGGLVAGCPHGPAPLPERRLPDLESPPAPRLRACPGFGRGLATEGMGALRGQKIRVLQGLLVSGQEGQAGPGGVAHLAGSPAPVLGGNFDDGVCCPGAWFARLRVSHEASCWSAGPQKGAGPSRSMVPCGPGGRQGCWRLSGAVQAVFKEPP